MTLPVIGIVGAGFLGQEIARLKKWPEASWGTYLVDQPPATLESLSLKLIQFDWQNPVHWRRMPILPAKLILTIPPLAKDIEQEKSRLKNWCEWMKRHRPDSSSLVYISTTGVYPNNNGLWQEDSEFEDGSPRSILRLITEEILGNYFDLRVIRPGAIYGRGRNVAERLLTGKPIPSGNHPVHRIHVTDLARIVIQAIEHLEFPPIVNAVDFDPAPTRKVAEWIVNQKPPGLPEINELLFKDGYQTRTHTPPSTKRFVSNQLLKETCDFQFCYPTYKEGLPACYIK